VAFRDASDEDVRLVTYTTGNVAGVFTAIDTVRSGETGGVLRRANFRILGVYLNAEQDVQAFETACGVRLKDLPLYEGGNSIERGKGTKTDKYVVTLPRPAKVVFKRNPRYEGEEDKKHSKRIFVRWHGMNGNSAPPATLSENSELQPFENWSSALGYAAHYGVSEADVKAAFKNSGLMTFSVERGDSAIIYALVNGKEGKTP